ncbi:MAG: hypothetical protein JFR38_04905 [Muribaculaceae bacterium]|nr:hypothetical protein [Muribaculaceae bacterium]
MNKKILVGLLSLTLGASFSLTSCDDVDDPVVSTTPIVKEVVTGAADVTATSATVTGTVTGISGQAAGAYTVGVVYSTSENPTAGGSRVAGTLGEDGTTVTTTINGLSDGVTYYYASFVTLQGTVSQYGEVKSFITTDSEIATAAPADVEATTANLSGTINGMQDKLDAGTLAYGIIIAPASKSIEQGTKLPAEGTDNAFTVTAKGLVPNTAYQFAAFMTVNGADVLGNVQQLTTPVGVNAEAESIDDYVNMGTRLEWCRYNVGAASEGDAGTLLGFGDITGFNYSTELYEYADADITGTERDAAVAAGMGFTPTLADWEELFAVCDIEEATVDGTAGMKLTSRTTGGTIFLPAAGKREGTNIDYTYAGMYWTGNVRPDAADYASLIMVHSGIHAEQPALRSTGALVRPVRKPFVNEIEADVTKLAVGDLESNGRIRIEIYNEFGSTSSAPAIDLSALSFESQMVVDFTLSGVTGNLKEGAKGSYRAGLEYAAAGWDPSYWSSFDGNAQDCIVNGDGNYRVCMNTERTTTGAVVFCIDIDGLGNDVVDKTNVKVEKLVISLDPKQAMYTNVDTSGAHIWFGNKEDNGTDVRIEFYNEYGPSNDGSGDPFAGVTFGQGTTVANVTISGVTGNLVSGAAGSYTGAMSLACGGWYPSWWGGGASDQQISGDGTYNFPAYIEANGTGTVVWCIDIVGLWKDLADTSKLDIKINSVTTPVHAQ